MDMCPEGGTRDWRDFPVEHKTYLTLTFGRHFQGASFDLGDPGLKPWAMVCSRFAANLPLSRTP
jgi:hypothetical protein